MSDLTFIEKKSSKVIIPRKKETKLDCVRRLTHLFMNDMFIHKIGDLSACEKLTVLYLQNNFLKNIENLDSAVSLTHLYLQNNQISKLENLDNLFNLKKLYLGHNCISVVEGLENLNQLEELHIEKQNLKNGESLCFDPRSVFGIKKTLKVLNVTGNKMTSLNELKPLTNLSVLIAKNNNLANLEDVTDTLRLWYYICDVNFIGNPVKKTHKYKDMLIINTHILQIIDGKQVNENMREYLKNLLREKTKQKNYKIPVNEEIEELSKGVPPVLASVVTKSLMIDSKSDTVQEFEIPKRHYVIPPKKNVNKFKQCKKSSLDSICSQLDRFHERHKMAVGNYNQITCYE